MSFFFPAASLAHTDILEKVCPYDSTILTIARSNPSDLFPKGQNAYTCRSCPYVSPLTHRMYDRNYMKRKEVEDVLGGEDGGGWGNVDQADGE